MKSFLKIILIALLLLKNSTSKAQIEVAQISTKDFSAIGFGGFLNFGVPVTEHATITAEAGAYIFKKDQKNIVLVPFLSGYRHSLKEGNQGFYVEPLIGYTIGGNDLYKTNPDGSLVDVTSETGSLKPIERKAKGMTGGLCTGYIFSGSFSFNIGMRYEHVFVSDDPSINLFSLRISHTISFGRKKDN